jgi:hypothetical protein
MNQDMKYQFQFKHSDTGVQPQIRSQFQSMFWNLEQLPDGPEKSVALRKLLESMDAALRCHQQ